MYFFLIFCFVYFVRDDSAPAIHIKENSEKDLAITKRVELTLIVLMFFDCAHGNLF